MDAHKADMWVIPAITTTPSFPRHLSITFPFPFPFPNNTPNLSIYLLFPNALTASSSTLGFAMQGDSSPDSMLTDSKEDNLVLSSEDSSCPQESELELGLGLSLSHPRLKSQPPPTTQFARILTAMDFSSSASSSSSPNVAAGTKRAADSLVATNGPSQVVGWPPLRAYRMNSFNNNHSKSPATEVKSNQTAARKITDNGSNKNNSTAEEKAHIRRSLFVKVNMDGTPIGRKVDLSAHSSYETLAHTLEDMFNERTPVVTKGLNGEDRGIVMGAKKRHLNLLDESSNFVITYEDKEGDWMLVGDVPWDMFIDSVRRLRIMRTSEANGLAPRLEEKKSRLRSERM